MPIPWIEPAPAKGGKELRLGYQVDPCTRARRVRVDYGDRTVKVTLGDPKRDPKKACIGIVERHCALVALDEPLGGRRVVDGAPHFRQRSRDLPIGGYGPCRPVEVASN